jgi:ABC-type proline/glycine betaine transport system substrate-binding protein
MLRKFGLSVLTAASVLCMAGAAEAKTKVVIGLLDWPGSTAIEHVLTTVMTDSLDSEVETISAAQEALYEALD